MFANACWTNNSNAKRDPYSEYNRVKEPFNMYLDVYVVSATMKSLGMEKLEDVPDAVPEHIRASSKERQRSWLHDFVVPMVEKYISFSLQDTVPMEYSSGTETTYPCRHPDCGRVFKYARCRKTHEKKKHNLVTEITTESSPVVTSTEDHVFNYGCVYITLGLMLRNADDAIKEGDGDRIMALWKFFMLFWKANNSHKYALAALHLQASVKSLLTQRQTHQLIHNRTLNYKGELGKRVPLDFFLELLNLVLKDSFKHLGVNLSESTAQTEGKAISAMFELINGHNIDLGMIKPSGYHKKLVSMADFMTVLNEVHNTADMFSHIPGREFEAFPSILCHGICMGTLIQ